ncbi:hypothetical protein [Mycolicibacterium aichiense]|uniref:Uncharacterized protein n=1 Tax=Mycolicibacterium aichiense TaxID=1799 RepID=A0A378VB09_9MYCO|nr:hypothetical protein [Mycolicibacterium aichiense]QFG08014.1 hypothetical protein SEA_HERBERTWM_45 [Mycobacterium phage Herbertwm]MCV7016776.1 hypothetical protein [Mycolicibacterium aichiense]SUA14006.1 Uncharacterised protein [Mycolicibacterium aichiense]SUA14416.1 Uncharacterised protein [Mycolicibacterium aichiense]BBX09441.1 hypothetical protein MAIC_42440 [Mycolicibacterium aichiense]
MKVTEKSRKTIYVEFEEGDTLYEAWQKLGKINAAEWPIKIEAGAIVIVEPERR